MNWAQLFRSGWKTISIVSRSNANAPGESRLLDGIRDTSRDWAIENGFTPFVFISTFFDRCLPHLDGLRHDPATLHVFRLANMLLPPSKEQQNQQRKKGKMTSAINLIVWCCWFLLFSTNAETWSIVIVNVNFQFHCLSKDFFFFKNYDSQKKLTCKCIVPCGGLIARRQYYIRILRSSELERPFGHYKIVGTINSSQLLFLLVLCRDSNNRLDWKKREELTYNDAIVLD